jgi:DUF3040 family protein
MALSQDEQRMLAEIERRLAADDPGLASCLTTFRRPGPGTVLRSPRARIIGSLFTVLLVAMISLMVYAMVPFQKHAPRQSPTETSSAPVHTAFSAASSGAPTGTRQSSASAGATSAASQVTQSGSAPAAASGKTQPATIKPTNVAMFPAAGGP